MLVEAADKYAELEKEKATLEEKLLACAKFTARNSAKKRRNDEDAVPACNHQKRAG